MNARAEIAYLRDRAKRIRDIVRTHTAISAETTISADLIKMAEDLEARAGELEDAGGYTKTPPASK